MPPYLASIVYASFIIWLYRRLAKETHGVSFALWIPLVWVGINASRPVVDWLATGTTASQADITEGDPVDRTIYLILLALAMITLAGRRIEWSRVFGECRWLTVFYLYLLLSTLWSDYTFVSFKRWFKDVGDVVMVLVIVTEAEPIEAIRWVFLRCAYVLIPVSVLFIKYYPESGRYYNQWTWATAYCGITTNKNSLGQLAMWSGLVFLWHIVDGRQWLGWRATARRSWPEIVLFAMCLWLLSLANSSTSLACFILGLAVFFGSRLQVAKANLKNVGWCLVGVAVILVAMTVNPGFRGMIAGSFGRDANLTDRTDIWAWALHLHTDPLIGSGFASTLLTFHNDPLVAVDHLAHVHNGYLQTYIDSGLIGVFLLLIVLFAAGRNAIRQLSQHTGVGHLFLAIFISSLFYNYTEVAFDRSTTIGFLLWLMAAYGVAANMSDGQTTTLVDESMEADLTGQVDGLENPAVREPLVQLKPSAEAIGNDR